MPLSVTLPGSDVGRPRHLGVERWHASASLQSPFDRDGLTGFQRPTLVSRWRKDKRDAIGLHRSRGTSRGEERDGGVDKLFTFDHGPISDLRERSLTLTLCFGGGWTSELRGRWPQTSSSSPLSAPNAPRLGLRPRRPQRLH